MKQGQNHTTGALLKNQIAHYAPQKLVVGAVA